MSKTRKKIVCLGGGNAMPNVVLAGLKDYDVEITSISSMSDSGGSAGEERKSYGTPVAYGDIRRAAYHLSGAPLNIRENLNKRLENDEDIDKAIEICPEIKDLVNKDRKKFFGHVLSNISSTATTINFDVDKAIKKLRENYQIPDKYKILPVTKQDSTLIAELENGEEIEGETNIDIPKHNTKLRIKKVFLRPQVKADPLATDAIKNADLTIIGPGDLYSSLAQILLVKGIPEAIKKSGAKNIYVCNLMQKKGETNDFKVSDFVKEIENYLGSKVDFVIYNTTQPSPKRLEEYKKEKPELIDMVTFDDLNDHRFIGEDLLSSFGAITHDSKKLAKIILNLCKL